MFYLSLIKNFLVFKVKNDVVNYNLSSPSVSLRSTAPHQVGSLYWPFSLRVRVSGGHLCEAEAPTEPAGEN